MAEKLFVPPYPAMPEGDLSFFELLRRVRRNALELWPRSAYEKDFARQQFLWRTRTVISVPEAIHHVLVEKPENYRRSRASIRILRPIFGAGLFLSEGDQWKLQRRTIAPALAPRVIPLLARHIVAATGEAVEKLREKASGPVDLLSATQALALEIIGRAMFSTEMHVFGPAMRAQLIEFMARHAQPDFFDLLLPSSIPSPRDFPRRRFQRRWMALIGQMVEARLQASNRDAHPDLLDLLRAARDPLTGAAFSQPQLCDQAATMIVAGHETTAVALFWSLYLLASAPDQQERVAEEVRGRDLGPASAADALAELPFTRAVVSEALRLFPPAFTLVREAIVDDDAAGIPIQRGSLVMIAPWVLHRHRKLWREPNAFDPNRFLPGAPTPPRFAYMPFGAGPRVCVGAQFAMAEATLALATLVQNFVIARDDGQPVLPAAVITTQPDHPPLFRLSPRQTSLPGAA